MLFYPQMTKLVANKKKVYEMTCFETSKQTNKNNTNKSLNLVPNTYTPLKWCKNN